MGFHAQAYAIGELKMVAFSNKKPWIPIFLYEIRRRYESQLLNRRTFRLHNSGYPKPCFIDKVVLCPFDVFNNPGGRRRISNYVSKDILDHGQWLALD